MADKGLIFDMVAAGADREEATRAVDAVSAALAARLKTGKAVHIAGVGELRAPEKAAWMPGYWRRKAVMQRKVMLRHPAVLERGEPYDV